MFKQIIDKDTETLTIYVDGAPVQAIAGETVAGVVLRLSSPVIRKTPVKGQMRAPYCLMGVCFECLAIVDGEASSQTCMIPVRHGMTVELQDGKRSI